MILRYSFYSLVESHLKVMNSLDYPRRSHFLLREPAAFYIEVENGTDKTGAPVYKKKTFSGIRKDADPQNVFNAAEAIKAVLKSGTRDCYLNESSKLMNS
jgi:hypothetical protein